MREAIVPGYRLRKAKISTKVLISLALLGLLLGLTTGMLLTVTRTGLSARAVERYYLGEQQAAGVFDSALSSLLIPSGPRPIGELAEVTHIHLTGGSIMLFLLCHLLSLCELKEGTRITLYSASFIAFLFTFGTPWLMILVDKRFSVLYGPSALILFCSLTVLAYFPLKEMWLSGECNGNSS